ncbi:MAG TPA: PilZ domain-containing protein [Dissulfurispiraceae bacterium]|nr:PilZ domain-containing protein [Dissulfurispiraceae bacterium]
MAEEKRRHKRVQVSVPVTINRSIRGQVVDLSESGVFIESMAPMEKGAALVIQFDNSEKKMLFGAVVRQSTRKKGRSYGFGAELGSLTPDHKSFLRALIDAFSYAVSDELPIILLIDGDMTSRFIFAKVIREGGYNIITRETFSDIDVIFEHHNPAAVVLDYTEQTLNAVKMIRGIDDIIPIVILSKLPHIPMEQFMSLNVKHCPKYNITPLKFVSDILRKLVPSKGSLKKTR